MILHLQSTLGKHKEMWYNKAMEYIDLMKISTEEAKQKRRQVVRLKKMGKSGREIEEIVGVRQNRISEI